MKTFLAVVGGVHVGAWLMVIGWVAYCELRHLVRHLRRGGA